MALGVGPRIYSSRQVNLGKPGPFCIYSPSFPDSPPPGPNGRGVSPAQISGIPTWHCTLSTDYFKATTKMNYFKLSWYSSTKLGPRCLMQEIVPK